MKLKNITLDYEYKIGNKILDQIDKSLTKKCKKYYLYGNHEDRYRRYMESKDNSKVGESLISPEIALNLKNRKYKIYTNWLEDSIKLGKHLEIIHGQYTPINAAKKHLDEYQGSIIFGHTHRIQSYMTAKRGSWNIGCLCDINSQGMMYMSKTQRNKWSNGFSIVNIDDKGNFWINTIQCFDNKFIYAGKQY